MPKIGDNIYKRKDGRYEARYVKERDINNKILKYGFVYGKTYKEAKAKKIAMMKDIMAKAEKETMAGGKSFSKSIMHWLTTKLSIKDTTKYNYYCVIVSRIIPFFKHIKVKNIKEEHIIKFTNQLQNEGLGNKRIKDILIILKQFFKSEGLRIDFEYPKVRKNTITTFTEDEVKILQRNLLNSDNPLEFGIILDLFTGLRIGELCALKWKDVDIDKQIIHVSKTLVRVQTNKRKVKTVLKVDSPKTETSIREVPIHNALVPYLKKFKTNDEYYVATCDKDFISCSRYYLFYKKILKNLEIRDYTFHTLRHTFATRALLNDIDVKTLSDILGHANIKVTLDRYVHVKPDEKLSQINKLPINI